MRTLRTTPLDVFPEFAPPLVEVQTEAPGLSTNDVEALVTVPLEAALNGVPGLETIRSKSVLGLSSVVLILDPATDVMTARQMVQERLSRAAATLPGGRPSAGDAVAAVLAQPRDEDRADVDDAVAGRDEHAGQVDDPAATDGHSRRRERRHLGPARSPDPGARRSRSAASARRDGRRRREGHGRGGLAAGRRLPRHAESAAGDHARRDGAHGQRSRSDRRRRRGTARRCGSATSPPSSKGSRSRSATPSSTTGPACC